MCMLKHVCTSVWLNQHASINTMNNTRENVWLSPQTCLKHLTQTISLSYHPFVAFLHSLPLLRGGGLRSVSLRGFP